MKEIFVINDRVRWANAQMVKEVRYGIEPDATLDKIYTVNKVNGYVNVDGVKGGVCPERFTKALRLGDIVGCVCPRSPWLSRIHEHVVTRILDDQGPDGYPGIVLDHDDKSSYSQRAVCLIRSGGQKCEPSLLVPPVKDYRCGACSAKIDESAVHGRFDFPTQKLLRASVIEDSRYCVACAESIAKHIMYLKVNGGPTRTGRT